MELRMRWLEVEKEGNTHYYVPAVKQGTTLAEFLEDFPTVAREQAVAALEEAGEAVVSHARSV